MQRRDNYFAISERFIYLFAISERYGIFITTQPACRIYYFFSTINVKEINLVNQIMYGYNVND